MHRRDLHGVVVGLEAHLDRLARGRLREARPHPAQEAVRRLCARALGVVGEFERVAEVRRAALAICVREQVRLDALALAEHGDGLEDAPPVPRRTDPLEAGRNVGPAGLVEVRDALGRPAPELRREGRTDARAVARRVDGPEDVLQVGHLARRAHVAALPDDAREACAPERVLDVGRLRVRPHQDGDVGRAQAAPRLGAGRALGDLHVRVIQQALRLGHDRVEDCAARGVLGDDARAALRQVRCAPPHERRG